MLEKLELLTTTVVQHTPPHWILGYRWTEMAAIVAVIGFVSAGVVGLVKVAIINPQNTINRQQAEQAELSNKMLRDSIDMLTKKVEGIGDNADMVHKDHDKRLDDHEVHLARHDEELRTLFERTGEKKS